MDEAVNFNVPTYQMKLPLLPKHSSPTPLDGTTESPAALVPVSTSTEQSPHSLSCGSASPLIEILQPDELARINTTNPPRPPRSPVKPGRRDGSRPRSLVKVSMVYNEYGELVEENKLQHHPTPDELNTTQLLRVIRKKFHHTVSASPEAINPLNQCPEQNWMLTCFHSSERRSRRLLLRMATERVLHRWKTNYLQDDSLGVSISNLLHRVQILKMLSTRVLTQYTLVLLESLRLAAVMDHGAKASRRNSQHGLLKAWTTQISEYFVLREACQNPSKHGTC